MEGRGLITVEEIKAQDAVITARENAFVPSCPYGNKGCWCDPAYILKTNPEAYRKMYGNIPPTEAVKRDGQCATNFARFRNCPDYEFNGR